MIDGFIVVIIISILSTIGIFCFLVYFLNKKKPALLKKSLIQTHDTSPTTTFNWETILALLLGSIAVGSGVYTILGVIVFIIYKELILDGTSIGIMAIVFLVFVGQELDKLWNKYLK
jgi:hypothetical protein